MPWSLCGAGQVCTPSSREAVARQLASGAVTILGLEVEGRLAAVALVSHDGRKGWINRLAVDPDYRRRGYGSQLVDAAVRLLREKGIRVVAALVTSDNEASLGLLSKAGFTDAGDAIHYLTIREVEPI
jgi:ribosomal protein S18 acetylase RimI-like enzyme